MVSKKKSESHKRSILKSITWRVTATLTTGILVWLFTGSFTLAISLASVEVILKMMFYYFHERIWNAVSWGKN